MIKCHTTKCIINGGAQCKFVVWFFKLRLVSCDSDALRIPATDHAQTLCAIFISTDMFNWLTKGIPKRIKINREEDYHTHYIGQMSDGGQFFGYETFIFPNGMPQSEDWTQSRLEYVVLYIFDKDGNHLRTKYWCAGTTSETNDSITRSKLEEFIKELGIVVYKDIKVKPFQTIIDGYTFGLVPNKEFKTVDLEPSSTISFSWPWNGEYNT